MKFKDLWLACLILTGLFIVSCKDDDNNDEKFSPLTVEENKAKIEDEGITLLNVAKEVENVTAINTSASLMNFMTTSDIFENNPNMNVPVKSSQLNSFFKPIIIATSQREFNPQRMAENLSYNNEEGETILELWNKMKGTYSWNSNTQSWNYVAGSEFEILFPSTENGTSNNASFRIYDFVYEAGPFSWTEGYTGELPKQIKSELKVGDNVALAYSLNITYGNTDKKPSLVKQTLELPPI